jgi:hypothetical protein
MTVIHPNQIRSEPNSKSDSFESLVVHLFYRDVEDYSDHFGGALRR